MSVSSSHTITLLSAKIHLSRDQYGALVIHRTEGACRSRLARAVRGVEQVLAELQTGNTDEHRAPAWEIGKAFDRHGQGEAVNVSIYGLDLVDGQPLGIVQVRQYTRTRYQARHDLGGSVKRNYFLIGRNEGTGLPFAHAIESRVPERPAAP